MLTISLSILSKQKGKRQDVYLRKLRYLEIKKEKKRKEKKRKKEKKKKERNALDQSKYLILAPKKKGRGAGAIIADIHLSLSVKSS